MPLVIGSNLGQLGTLLNKRRQRWWSEDAYCMLKIVDGQQNYPELLFPIRLWVIAMCRVGGLYCQGKVQLCTSPHQSENRRFFLAYLKYRRSCMEKSIWLSFLNQKRNQDLSARDKLLLLQYKYLSNNGFVVRRNCSIGIISSTVAGSFWGFELAQGFELAELRVLSDRSWDTAGPVALVLDGNTRGWLGMDSALVLVGGKCFSVCGCYFWHVFCLEWFQMASSLALPQEWLWRKQ